MLSLSILRLFSFSGEADKFIEKFQQLLDTPEERRMFVQFCVLSGCDFLESLPSVGIVVSLHFKKQLMCHFTLLDGSKTSHRIETRKWIRDRSSCFETPTADEWERGRRDKVIYMASLVD